MTLWGSVLTQLRMIQMVDSRSSWCSKGTLWGWTTPWTKTSTRSTPNIRDSTLPTHRATGGNRRSGSSLLLTGLSQATWERRNSSTKWWECEPRATSWATKWPTSIILWQMTFSETGIQIMIEIRLAVITALSSPSRFLGRIRTRSNRSSITGWRARVPALGIGSSSNSVAFPPSSTPKRYSSLSSQTTITYRPFPGETRCQASIQSLLPGPRIAHPSWKPKWWTKTSCVIWRIRSPRNRSRSTWSRNSNTCNYSWSDSRNCCGNSKLNSWTSSINKSNSKNKVTLSSATGFPLWQVGKMLKLLIPTGARW